MAGEKGDRTAYWPAIEAKYGEPMGHWFAVMGTLADQRYPEQVAFLRENYGFSQAHANALVMYCRGSKSSKRFATFDDYLASVTPAAQTTIRELFASLQRSFPELELVIAWNQPMLKSASGYVFGVAASKNYLLIAPWSQTVVSAFAPRLSAYKVNKKTIQVPFGWKIDQSLVQDLVAARLDELGD